MLGAMKRTNWWLAIVVLLIPLAYLGSYTALVQRQSLTFWEAFPAAPESYNATGSKKITIYSYRCGSTFSKILVSPINRIEQRFRSKKTATR